MQHEGVFGYPGCYGSIHALKCESATFAVIGVMNELEHSEGLKRISGFDGLVGTVCRANFEFADFLLLVVDLGVVIVVCQPMNGMSVAGPVCEASERHVGFHMEGSWFELR